MNMLSYLAFFCALFGFALVIFAIWSDPRAWINRVAAVALFFYSLFAFSQIFILSAADPPTFWFFQKLSYIGTSFYLPTGLSFILLFCGVRLRSRLLLLAPFYLIAIVFSFVALTGELYFSGFRPGPYGNLRIPAKDSIWGLILFVEMVCAALISLVVPLRAMLKSGSYRFRRICLVVGSLALVAFGLYLFSEAVVARLWGLPSMTFLCGLVNPLCMTFYLTVKYRYLKQAYPLLEQGILVAVDRAIVLVDSNFKVLKLNQAAARLCGMPETDVQDSNFLALFPDYPNLAHDWTKAAAESRVVETDLHLGILPELHLIVTPHKDQFGDLIGSIIIIEPSRGSSPKPERSRSTASQNPSENSQRRLAGIDPEAVIESLDRLFAVKKFYKRMNLRVADVANALGISVHQLSAVLNDVLHRSFADIVNDYRVNEAKQLLLNQPKMSVLEIAFESGFSSKTQFNSVFKRQTGLSPRYFRESQQIFGEKSPVL